MIKEEVGEDVHSYVFITCEEEDSNGNIQVKMTYQGDPILVSYLLETAQKKLEQDFQELNLKKSNIS